MRDPLAPDPVEILDKQPLISSKVKSRWIPYQSLQHDFVLKRATTKLQPPQSVDLKLNEGVLVISGHAPHSWVATLQSRTAGLAGISSIDTRNLKDDDAPVIEEWNELVDEITQLPGIAVNRATVDESLNFSIKLLRDPLAPDPAQLLGKHPDLRKRVKIYSKPYVSSDPQIVRKRAQAALNPPDGIKLRIDDKCRLTISGHAPHNWLQQAKVVAPSIAGVASVDFSDLHDASGNRYSEWQKYLAALDETQDLTVIEHGERKGKFYLIGFAGEMAPDPYELMKPFGISRREIYSRWLPSPQTSKKFVLANAIKTLNPPQTVTLQRIRDQLIATGAAPHRWIEDARIIARCLPEISSFNDDLLVDLDIEQLDRTRYNIEKIVIICGKGSASPQSGQEAVIAKLAKTLKHLHVAATELDAVVRITIIGHAPDQKSAEKRRTLAEERAQKFKKTLIKAGAPQCMLYVEAADTKSAENSAGLGNGGSITFRALIETPED
jgi:hypothetical protein